MRHLLRFSFALALFGVAVLPAAAAPITSIYTEVGKPSSGEPGYASAFGLLDNFGSFYGGTWTQTPGTANFTNGQYVATRITDGYSNGKGGPISITTDEPAEAAGLSDQIWTVAAGTKVSFTSIMKYSGAPQQFGVYAGDGSGGKGTFTALGSLVPAGTSKANTGYWKGGTGSDLDLYALTGGTFRWSSQTGRNYTSNNADNGSTTVGGHTAVNGGIDRMITYLVTGRDGNAPANDPTYTPHFLLFFEDGSDFDFNDLVVEVNAGGHYAPPSVPVPPMVIPALVSLGGLGLAGLRKRRARA